MAFATLFDQELGEVRISWRRTSRVTARWDKGRALLIVPLQCSMDHAKKILEDVREFLLTHRPSHLFVIGCPLRIDGGPDINFERSRQLREGVDVRLSHDGGVVVRIAEGIDPSDPHVEGVISRLLVKVAEYLAPSILLPELRAEASRLRLAPSSMKISRGHKVLGHCSRSGEIAISAACVFLTKELRRYIYCHELAHLTEMNHSPRFHTLCDSYLDGKERELQSALRKYHWPVAL